MAKIFRTKTQPARSRMLLRAGLSIFLFLQIHKPDAAVTPVHQISAQTLKKVEAAKEAALKLVKAPVIMAGN